MKRRVVTRGGKSFRAGQWGLCSNGALEGSRLPTALGGDHGNSEITEFEIGRDFN